MMRIIYISRINLLSGRTNVYDLAKTCEALNAQKDFSLKLITTDYDRDRNVFFQKMGILQPFDITCLGVTNTSSHYGGKRWYELLMFLFANIRLTLFLFLRTKEFDIVYFRDESLFPTVFCVKMILRKRVFFETHSVLKRRLRQQMNVAAIRLADGVIAISSGLKDFYQKINKNVLLSFCSATDDPWFDYSKERDTFRRELGLSTDVFIIGYAGVVGANPNNDYYEVDDVIRSLHSLPENILCVIVGEINNNAEWLRNIAEESGVLDRVIILPWAPRSQIPKYLRSFDAVLIPKRKKNLIGDSPAKMFTALSARRPIIAGQSESILEILTDGKDAIIVEKNSPDEWVKAILKIYKDPKFAEKISDGAWITKDKYTWPKRGMAITEFINKTIQNL